jgi:hypothetical protein
MLDQYKDVGLDLRAVVIFWKSSFQALIYSSGIKLKVSMVKIFYAIAMKYIDLISVKPF